MKRSLLRMLCLLACIVLPACSPQINAPTAFPSPTSIRTRTAAPAGTLARGTEAPDGADAIIPPSVSTEADRTAPPAAAEETPLAPAPTEAETDPAPPQQATEETDCTNNLVYLMDLSLPDGTVVSAGQALDKRWRVENTGTCAWDAGYRLRLVEGEPLGAPEEQALYPALTGTQATLRLLLTAPTEPGVYRSAWQAADPEGELFGDPVYIEIVVEADN